MTLLKLKTAGALCSLLLTATIGTGCNIQEKIEEKVENAKLNQAIQRNLEAPFKRFFVEDALERNAVCNDGTPAAYYFKPGFAFKDGERVPQNQWVIHLKGGGACDNDESCLERMAEDDADLERGAWKHRMSSKSYKEETDFGGIMNSDPEKNSEFHNFNKVFVMYCSSDSYVGDAPADETRIYHFRGKTIVRSIIEDLKKNLRLNEAKHVLFSGSSAGGNGMALNLDMVAARLPQARVIGVKDAGFTPSLAEVLDLKDEQDERSIQIQEYQNPVYPKSCADDLEGTDELFKCGQFSYLYENDYIKTRFFVYTDQADPNKIEKLGLDEEGAELFRQTVRDDIERYNGPGFSTDRGTHVAITDDVKFLEWKVAGASYKDILANFFFKRPGRVKVIEYKD